jgi:hypothetical protein
MYKKNLNNRGLQAMKMNSFMQNAIIPSTPVVDLQSGGQPSVQSAATQPRGQQEIEKFVPEIKAALQKGASLTEIILILVQKEMPIDMVQQLLMSSGVEENELLNAFEEIQQAQIQDEVASTQISMPVNEQQEQMIPTEPGMQEQQMGAPSAPMMQNAGEVGDKGMVMTKFGEDSYVAPELDEFIVNTTNPYADKYPYWNQLPEHTKKIIQENNPGPALRSALSTAKHGDGLINPRTGKRNQSYSDEVVSNLVAPGMAFAALPMAAAIGPEILAGLNAPMIGGISALDALGAYGAYEGATHLPGHVSEFAEDPSWGGAGNIGLDMLGLAGGIGALSKLSKLPAKTKDLFKGKPIPEFGGRRWGDLSDMERQVYIEDAMNKLGPKYGLGTSQVEKNTLNKVYDDLFKDPKNIDDKLTKKIAQELKKRNAISDIGGFEFGPAQHTVQKLINSDDGIKNLAELDKKLSDVFDLGKGSLPADALDKAKGLGIDDFDFKPMSPGAKVMEEAKLLAADVKGPGFARSTDFPSPMNDEHKRLFHQYKSAPLEEMSDLIRKGMIKKFGSDKVLKYAVNNLEENRRLGPQGYYGKFKPLTRNEIGANLLGVLDDSSPILKYNYRLNELVNQYNRYIKMGIDPNKPGMLSLQDKIKNFPRKKHHHFDKWDKFSGKDLPKAQTGLSSLAKLIKTGGKNYSKFNLGKDVYKYTPNFTKNILRGINTSTLGTANAIAKTIAPVMINPLTFGLSVEEFGPFTGSPLNFIPSYGKTLPSSENTNPGVAYRKFGDNLDYVKSTGIISPAHGRKFRMGKEQIQGEGNWAEMGNINEKYPGVFAASFDTNVPGTNINITDGRELNRNGVLVREGNNFTGTVPYNSIMDPGVKLHRRLPFSNKYVDVNMDKLRGDKFDPATMGGNLQSLLERYGYAAGIAGGLGLAGINIPQEYLDEYVNNPIKENYIKLKGLFDKPIKKEKDGGMVVNLSQKEIDQYAKEGWIIEDV